MKVHTSDKIIAYLTLLSGLSISAVAVWYSVAGLVAIFAAAAIPIMIMGVALEVSKLVATVWLKMNWKRAPYFIRTYLLAAIIILMLITSMGIFGFLSKAHLDQAVPTGDVQDKVSLLDEKIKTQQDNIDAARKALKQMDAQVDEKLARTTDDKGAERAVQIRRNQSKERNTLQNEIGKAQKEIAQLKEQRAPIAKELRKVEAEVGPIKYIAALIYGDNPDANILEKAVRWVIIIIVTVFDPLAVILLIASQISFQWFRQDEDEGAVSTEEPKKPQRDWTDFFNKKPKYELDDGPLTEEQLDKIKEMSGVDQHAYLKKPWVWNTKETVGPQVADNSVKLFEKEPEKPQQPAGWDDEDIPEPKSETSGKQKLSLSNLFKNKKLKTVASGNPLDVTSSDFFEHITDRKEETFEIPTEIETKKSLDPSGTSIEDWNKMIEEAEKAVEEEKEQEEKEIIDSASESEKAAMQAWKHDHPESSLKLQRRLLERGVINKLPWEDYLKAQPDFIEEPVVITRMIAPASNPDVIVTLPKTTEDESKKKDNIVDGMGGRTPSEEEQRDIGYVQNAEQGEQTLWQRIKKGI